MNETTRPTVAPPSAKPRIQRPFVLQVFAHSHQFGLHLIAGAA